MYLILALWGKYHFYFNFTDDETEQRKIKPLAWGPTSGVWWRQRAIQLQSLCPSPKGSAAPLHLSLGPAFTTDRSPDGGVTLPTYSTPSPYHPHLQTQLSVREVEAKDGGGLQYLQVSLPSVCRMDERQDRSVVWRLCPRSEWQWGQLKQRRGSGQQGWSARCGIWCLAVPGCEAEGPGKEICFWSKLGGTWAFERGDAEFFFWLVGNVRFRNTGQELRVFRCGNVDSDVILLVQSSCIFFFLNSFVDIGAHVGIYRFL